MANNGATPEPIEYGRAKHPNREHPMVYKWGTIPEIRHVTRLGGCCRPYIYTMVITKR